MFKAKSICPCTGWSSIWLVVSLPFCATTGVIAMWFSYTTCCFQRVRLFDLSLVGTSRKLFCTRLSSNVRSDEMKRLLNVNARRRYIFTYCFRCFFIRPIPYSCVEIQERIERSYNYFSARYWILENGGTIKQRCRAGGRADLPKGSTCCRARRSGRRRGADIPRLILGSYVDGRSRENRISTSTTRTPGTLKWIYTDV